MDELALSHWLDKNRQRAGKTDPAFGSSGHSHGFRSAITSNITQTPRPHSRRIHLVEQPPPQEADQCRVASW
jgi:hypothetical protein